MRESSLLAASWTYCINFEKRIEAVYRRRTICFSLWQFCSIDLKAGINLFSLSLFIQKKGAEKKTIEEKRLNIEKKMTNGFSEEVQFIFDEKF